MVESFGKTLFRSVTVQETADHNFTVTGRFVIFPQGGFSL
jgi:hypothetical protein